ncbi:hypothetical protein AM588_10000858 [Phytophthora nicotianae]|uniref:Uncharacterized protein n=1 Tax=Phytophthora nicotianae TaxID=4792 RepID=A0A0W8CMQ1_PHYNI|nr:hypothetical protein AM588_10000858 [Phytophthora nicotianae]
MSAHHKFSLHGEHSYLKIAIRFRSSNNDRLLGESRAFAVALEQYSAINGVVVSI